MSTQQRNSACVVRVDPSTVDILRRQTLVVLEANHYFFEEILEFGPEAQHALSVIYRDAVAVHLAAVHTLDHLVSDYTQATSD